MASQGLSPEEIEGAIEKAGKDVPAGTLGRPEDIGTAAVFLASRAADYVVGATLVVDGGMVLT